MARKKATTKQKDEALQLLRAGMLVPGVAEKTGLTKTHIGAMIGGWRRAGLLPDYKPQNTPPPIAIKIAKDKARSQPDPSPTPTPIDDGFDWKLSSESPDGFPHQEITYDLERIDPPEGHLGRHSHPFTKQDIGMMYGGLCRYKLTRHVPGQRPESTEFPMSGVFGPPKTPKRFSELNSERAHRGEGSVSVDPNADKRLRPAMWMNERWQSGQGWEGRLLEKIFNDAKSEKTPSESPIVLKLLEQQKDGSDAEKRREEKRLKDEQDRRDTLDKDERSRRETLELDYRKRQQDIEGERDKAHQRELDRIKAENDKIGNLDDKFNDALKGVEKERRETIQDLEKERTRLLEKQFKDREDLLKKEMVKLEKGVEEDRAGIAEELKEQQKRTDREFDLREQAFESHQKLEKQIIEMRGEFDKKELEYLKKLNNGDSTQAIIEVVERVAGKAENSISKLVKVRQMELGKGSEEETDEGGNVPPEKSPEEAEAKKEPTLGDQNDMKDILQDIFSSEAFQSMAKEWGRHVKAESDPALFANMYLEWMRDGRVEATETRQALSTFGQHMRTRDWQEILGEMREYLQKEKDTLKIFEEHDYAEDFYEDFKLIVCGHISQYYEQWREMHKQQLEQRREARKSKKKGSEKETPVKEEAKKDA